MIISYRGKKVEVEVEDVISSKEEWNVYKLKDGTELKVKLVLATVYKLKNDYIEETGEPIYVIKSENIVTANVPEELLRKE